MRSGSTLLCAALDDPGIAGHPEEHFEVLLETGHARQPRDYFQRSNDPEVWALLDDPEFRDVLGEYGGRYSEHPARRDPLWRPPDFERLAEGALHKGKTENGVLGTKIMWAYFRDFVRLARRTTAPDLRPCEVSASVLPNLRRFVWMRRRDTTRQAVSLWKALQTQHWRRDSDEDVGGQGLRFSFAAIDHLKLRIDEHNAAWQDFFEGCGVEPMEVGRRPTTSCLRPTCRTRPRRASTWPLSRRAPARQGHRSRSRRPRRRRAGRRHARHLHDRPRPRFPGAKATLYNRGLGVMLILRGPGGFTGGEASDALVSHIDLFPTVCDLAGVERPEWLQGESLLPLANGEAEEIRDAIFAEKTYHVAYEPERCVRTHRWKYIRRFGERTKPVLPNTDDGPSKELLLSYGWGERDIPPEQLYDLVLDPNEAYNLAGSPTHSGMVEEMREKLKAWMVETKDPLLEGDVPAPEGAELNDPDGLSPNEPTIVT